MKRILSFFILLTSMTLGAEAQNACNAEFNFSIQSGNIVTFTPANAADTVGVQHLWRFGDNTTSSAISPTHNYAQTGSYPVWHIKKKLGTNGSIVCKDSSMRIVNVQNTACNLVAGLQVTRSNANGNTVYYSNTSTPFNATDSVRFTFGDGTSSNQHYGSHAYMQAGTYTICIRVQQRNPQGQLTNCVKEKCETIQILQDSCNLQAYFSVRRDSTAASPLTYIFTNHSTPLAATDSIRWTFGDGSSSNIVNPHHTYSQAGTYAVCLRVIKRTATGALGCARDFCKTIVVGDCNGSASFTQRADSINKKKIYFTNTTPVNSASATVTWTFGDGSSSTAWNPIHEYATAGRYNVCLRIVTAPNCVREKCDSVVIAENCVINSQFTYTKVAIDSRTYSFTPQVIATNLQYLWTFGDGQSSTSPVVTHNYAAAGTYTVCLTVKRGTDCMSKTCTNIVVGTRCDSTILGFTAVALQPALPHKITFTAQSNKPILSQKWVITKRTPNGFVPYIILNAPNPVYTFADSGIYKVCLIAKFEGNCIKEKCEMLVIARNSDSSVCRVNPYPNPTTGIISTNVYLTQPQVIKVFIYNNAQLLVRTKIVSGTVGQNVISIGMHNLPAGIYTMKVVRADRECRAAFLKL